MISTYNFNVLLFHLNLINSVLLCHGLQEPEVAERPLRPLVNY